MSTLKVESIRSSRALVTTYKTTLHYSPEDCSRHFEWVKILNLAAFCTCLYELADLRQVRREIPPLCFSYSFPCIFTMPCCI